MLRSGINNAMIVVAVLLARMLVASSILLWMEDHIKESNYIQYIVEF